MNVRALTVSLLALLLACDDATVITHVFKLPNIRERDLFAMQTHGGIATEVHGLPFPGATPEAVAEAMQGPQGAAAVRFRAQEIVGPEFHGSRMVLHFNPLGAPNGPADCALTGPARTGEPTEKGFTVNMTFCRGQEVEAQGYLQAPEVAAGDHDAFARVMRQLLNVVFREEPDR